MRIYGKVFINRRNKTGTDLVFTVSYDEWSNLEFCEVKNLIKSDGYVVGAFFQGHLKGFASVESAVFGTHAKYIDLSNIHISQDMRRQGIGKELFALAKKWAREHEAEI